MSELPARPEPQRRPGLGARLHGVIAPEATPVYLFEDVLRQLLRHARPHDQAGGLLQGRLLQGEGGPYVEVDGFAAAGPVGSNSELARRLAEAPLPQPDPERPEAPGRVGWFHSRLAPGPGPTPQDVAIHRACLEAPWAVMLLIERASGRIALFRVTPSGPLSTGFYVVHGRPATPEPVAAAPTTPVEAAPPTTAAPPPTIDS